MHLAFNHTVELNINFVEQFVREIIRCANHKPCIVRLKVNVPDFVTYPVFFKDDLNAVVLPERPVLLMGGRLLPLLRLGTLGFAG